MKGLKKNLKEKNNMDKQQLERDIRRGYKITVQRGRWDEKSLCKTKGCKRKQKYLVFAWDGEPMLSRLETMTCAEHLSNGVEKARKYNEKLIKEQIQRKINQIKKDAEELKK